jgi:hypothetical protein
LPLKTTEGNRQPAGDLDLQDAFRRIEHEMANP